MMKSLFTIHQYSLYSSVFVFILCLQDSSVFCNDAFAGECADNQVKDSDIHIVFMLNLYLKDMSLGGSLHLIFVC